MTFHLSLILLEKTLISHADNCYDYYKIGALKRQIIKMKTNILQTMRVRLPENQTIIKRTGSLSNHTMALSHKRPFRGAVYVYTTSPQNTIYIHTCTLIEQNNCDYSHVSWINAQRKKTFSRSIENLDF